MQYGGRYGYRRQRVRVGPELLRNLYLSSGTVAENVASGSLVGALVGVRSGSTFDLIDDAGGRFALDGSNVETATLTDVAVDTYFDIDVEETNGAYPNSPRVSTLSILVLAVADAGLVNAPTLTLADNSTYPPPLSLLVDETGVVDVDSLQFQSSATLDFASPLIDEAIILPSSGSSLLIPGLSAIDSPDETYFRARVISVANGTGPWSPVVKHGDATAPTITSSSTTNIAEFTVGGSGVLTANEDIALWEISGGADAGDFSIVGNTWTLNVVPDFEDQASYAVQFRATDYGGNQSTQDHTANITDVDDTPNALGLTDVPSGTLSTLYTSNTITIAGLAGGLTVPVTITGGEYQKNGGSWTTSAGTATNGDTFAVRQTSSGLNSTTINVVLRVGETTDTYSITTEPSASLPSLVATANPARQNLGYSANSYNFAAQPIGAAATTRIVLVAVDWFTGGSAPTVTIGGITATAHGGASSPRWYSAIVPTGTTADIVVNSVDFYAYVGIQVLALYDANATPTDTQALAGGFNNSPHAVTVTTATDGFTVIVCEYESATAPTWNGATVAYTRTVSGVTMTCAYTQTSGVKSVTGIGNLNSSMKSVSFQP